MCQVASHCRKITSLDDRQLSLCAAVELKYIEKQCVLLSCVEEESGPVNRRQQTPGWFP